MNPKTPVTKAKLKSIFSKRNRNKIIIIIAVIIILAAAAFGIYRLFFMQEEREAVTGKTTFGYLNESIEGSGTTTPADSVSYDVNGSVLEWNVSPGDEVKTGDLLYVLDSSEAEDEILENEVELDELYDKLSDLQESIINQRVTASFSGRVEEISVKEGKNVQNGAVLGKLVDDSVMKATLYFSYIYEEQLKNGMTVSLSFPDLMLTLDGRITDIKYVDYTTPEGMKCFGVTVEVDNPGSLTEGTIASCWAYADDGSLIYAVSDAVLEYRNSEQITAGAAGEISSVNVVNYERVTAGETMFVIDATGYETQLETVKKQIKNAEEKIADLQESIDTEYTRYSDIDGQVVTAAYSKNRMTGNDMGSVVIYNQETMEISVNIDELDADFLSEGMDVNVYRTTSSDTVYYPAKLTYLSLEATAGSSGVSTFEATITIYSEGNLSSGVTVYYSIDTSGSDTAGETVLAPLNALCTYDDGYYLLVASDKAPENAIVPAEVGGSVTDYPSGYYAVPVEAGSYNENYVQILSGIGDDETLFLRYRNTAPKGGSTTSEGDGSEDESYGMFPGGNMPDFSGGNMPDFSGGGMPDFSGSGRPDFSGGGGSRN